MRIAILHRPAADLSTVQLEVVQAQGFRGGEAVRARRDAHQTLFRRSVTGSGQAVVWSPPEIPGIHTLAFFRPQARR